MERLKEEMGRRGLEGFITFDRIHVRYLTGFTGSSAALALTPRGDFFFTDSRYEEQCAREIRGLTIKIGKNPLAEMLLFLDKNPLKTIGFESHRVTYGDYTLLKKGVESAELVPTSDMVEKFRLVKGEEEVEKIKKAISIARLSFENIQEIIRPAVRERDIAVELEYQMRKNGANGLAFDTIVASGERGGMPHAMAGDKKLERGDLVVIDFGAQYEGYFSDTTRTLCVGDHWDEEKRKIYETVREAQKRAVLAVKEGVTAAEVDSEARRYINEAGLGNNFGHGTGHGVGLEIHEGPRVAPGQETVLKKGMVITIEPGVYLPQWGGVRIEDMVLVKEEGGENLTGAISKTTPC